VQVSADIDFDHVETSEDTYDPDTIAVRSEQLVEEKELDKNAQGIPGVKGGLANKLQGNLGNQDQGLVTKKKEETKNYEVSRVKRQTRSAVGKLKRLSVGVLIDGTYEAKDGKTEYVPRTPEEMAKFQNIVRAAMGFSEERGDDLSVQNVPFSETRTAEASMTEMVNMGVKVLKPLTNLILALLFIFLVLRPILNRYVLASKEEEAPAGHEGGMLEGEALPEIEAPTGFEPGPDAAEELRELATEYPERAAALIKVWLREKGESPDAAGH
jgi:flagellar M-ring protein FliF